tara:strand:- start:1479 stop:1850 length:372 start_codon:yes stop_codon:yes gene_type:complete
MLIDENSIDSLSVEYINYFTALALGYFPTMKLINNEERCILGGSTVPMQRFESKGIISILINDGLSVSIKYTSTYIECQIISKDGCSAFFGYAGTADEATCKALIIQNYHNMDVPVNYETTLH